MPDIKFVNSPRSEQTRLKLTSRVMASGFYQKHGFLVMPRVVRGLDANVTVVYPKSFVYRQIEVKEWENDWKAKEEVFWREIEHYFPGCRSIFGETEVRVTRYGTIATGDWIKDKKEQHLVYYLRLDGKSGELAAMMVNNILFLEKTNLGITWSKREALMDFVMTRPGMKKLFPDFRPVMSQLSRVSAKARKQSEKYLRDLGIPSVKREFEIEKMPLSKLEKKVMRLLVEHQGELVSYDDLADTVWGVGEFKTFWALNKLIERMRPKLTKLGIDGKQIESVRGQGYLLK